jgi:hypothetical protein
MLCVLLSARGYVIPPNPRLFFSVAYATSMARSKASKAQKAHRQAAREGGMKNREQESNDSILTLKRPSRASVQSMMIVAKRSKKASSLPSPSFLASFSDWTYTTVRTWLV